MSSLSDQVASDDGRAVRRSDVGVPLQNRRRGFDRTPQTVATRQVGSYLHGVGRGTSPDFRGERRPEPKARLSIGRTDRPTERQPRHLLDVVVTSFHRGGDTGSQTWLGGRVHSHRPPRGPWAWAVPSERAPIEWQRHLARMNSSKCWVSAACARYACSLQHVGWNAGVSPRSVADSPSLREPFRDLAELSLQRLGIGGRVFARRG